MNDIDHALENLQEVPPDPESSFNLRRVLALIAGAGLLLPCGLCWYSTRVEAIESALIPGLLAVITVFYTLFTFYQREQKQDLAPPLWRVILVFILLLILCALALSWLLSALGWQPLPASLILALGGWSLFLSGRRVWGSWVFSRKATVEENGLAELKMISIEGGHPVHPQLVYRYAEGYRGQKRGGRIKGQLPQIREAINENKLRVMVKYLPEDPRVHRFMGWKIEP
jgi:hypothetical protein